jgi:hypothetical protein
LLYIIDASPNKKVPDRYIITFCLRTGPVIKIPAFASRKIIVKNGKLIYVIPVIYLWLSAHCLKRAAAITRGAGSMNGLKPSAASAFSIPD